jgi:glucosamine--fructose-6-phosphate aminotransferase (isomerizing)
MSLREEIGQQPEVARRLLDGQMGAIEEIAAALEKRPINGIMIAARGTSDHAAIYAQYLFGAFHRLPVALAAPALVSIYGTPPHLEGWLTVGISQSGRSPDVVGVISAARMQGGRTVAITNEPDSELARAAEFSIALSAGPERAVAATKTYTAELLAVAALASAYAPAGGRAAAGPGQSAAQGPGEPGAEALEQPGAEAPREPGAEPAADPFGGSREARMAALDQVPGALEQVLAAESDAERIAGERRDMDQCIVLGRGFEYATAREWALKLKELAQVGADPYSPPDFEHGPLALIEPGYPVFAIAPSGLAAPDVDALLGRLREDFDVDLVVISDVARTRELGRASMAMPPGLAEWLTPIVSIVPAQLFAYHLTRAKGLDTETPRWISKVTLTR